MLALLLGIGGHMKNLLVGVCLGFLLSSLWNKHASAGQTQAEPARIWVGTELQLGMPKDSVIMKVAEGGYEIKRATAIEGDYWTITKKNEKNEYDLVGTVTFRGGKLDWAEHTLYSSFDQSAAKFARNLYFALRDLEVDHNNVCTLENKNQESAAFYSKTGMLHCGRRTISVIVSKYQDQNEEGQLGESVK
jgi:hypothetical protein